MTGQLSRPVRRGEENHPLMRWYPSYPMASGRCCGPGCDRTAASPRRNSPSISASSNSLTTCVAVEKPYSAHSSRPWSREPLITTPEPVKRSPARGRAPPVHENMAKPPVTVAESLDLYDGRSEEHTSELQ